MYMGHYGKVKYLKVGDVRENPIRGVITGVEIGERYDKPIITLDRGEKLSLNATNVTILNLAFGFDDQDWLNKEIELYVGLIRYDGKDQDGILIKPLSQPNPDARRNPIRKSGDDMDDEIKF